MSEPTTIGRRALLKGLLAGGGAVLGTQILPGEWGKPLANFGTLPAHAQTSAGLKTLTVQADIDGRSRLIIWGDQCWWEHFEFQPPTNVFLNGVPWSNLGLVADCVSSCSGFATSVPSLTPVVQTVLLYIDQARGSVTINPQPISVGANIVVEFNDNGFGGAFTYIIRLEYL